MIESPVREKTSITPPGPNVGKFEIVGLDQDERFLDFRTRRIGNDVVEDAAIGIGKLRPELQVFLDRLLVERGDHGRLEVGHLARFIGNVIAVGVANRLAARPLVHDVSDDISDFLDRIRSTENQQENARALVVAFAGEIFLDVIAEQFLGGAMPRVLRGDDALGVAPDEFFAGGEHPSADQVEPGAGDQSGNDPAGARFAHRVRSNDNVGKLISLHKEILSG